MENQRKPGQNGKGSKRRVGNNKAYRENWEEIFKDNKSKIVRLEPGEWEKLTKEYNNKTETK